MDYWKGEINGFTVVVEPHACGRYYVAVEDREGRVTIDPSLSAERVSRLVLQRTFPALVAMMREAKMKAKTNGNSNKE